MDILDRQLARAKKLGITNIISIGSSPRKGKRFRASVMLNGKLHKIDYGADAADTFLDHGDEERRRLFHARFRNNKGYNDKSSPLYWSSRLLW